MKILCVADETDPLVYSPSCKRIFGDCEFVISAGDLPLRYYDYIMTIMGKDLYYVYGNHNLEQFKENVLKVQTPSHNPFNSNFAYHFGGNLIEGKCIYDKRSDLIIMGLGGSMLYNNGLSQYSEKQMKWRINKLIPRLLFNKQKYGRYVDILVTHAPVFGMGDGIDICHRGFECFKTFIDKYRPKYLLHGHIHLFDENENRFYQYGDTTIINVYKSFVIDDPTLGRKDG